MEARKLIPSARMAKAGQALALTLLVLSCAPGEAPEPDLVEWPSYAADKASTKFSPLTQIDASNVDRLEVAWRWTSPDEAVREEHPELWTWMNESTPVMVDGVLYTSTSMSQVAALDAATGREIWVYDPKSYEEGSTTNHYHHRGVAYWEKGDLRRIFLATGDGFLIALDATTGQPVASFGDGGRVDLTQGLGRPVARFEYGVSSPPIVCRDGIVVGSSILDFPRAKEMPRGDVRSFDAETGALRWTFRPIPQGEDLGADTWENGSNERSGNTNVWTMMSCDEELGRVYLPFSTPTNDYYGADRLGDNLFAESLVAVDAESGERSWHFQVVHHGLWDYDLPAAPNLVDLTVDGKPIKAVVQITKQAFAFAFDRETGEPIWPIEERPVPPSTLPGERASLTQPFPTRPAPFDRQGVSEDDVIDFTPELKAAALGWLEQFHHGPLYTPPGPDKTILMPGINGGGSWAGAAFDPDKGILYIPSQTSPNVLRMLPTEVVLQDPRAAAAVDTYHHFFGDVRGLVDGPQGLPWFKPPYGRITAIDLNTGEHLWQIPLGEGPRDHPALEGLDLPQLGTWRRAHVVLTPTLLFAALNPAWKIRGRSPHYNADELETWLVDPSLEAFDPRDGHKVAEVPLPANATGAFITYMVAGRQYIAIPTGGASQPAELVVLALPE